MDISVRKKKSVLIYDAVGEALTISCVILYILSILCLQSFWPGTRDTKEIYTIVFTAIAVAFDTSSVSLDIASYVSGRKIYKSIMNNTADEVEKKLSHHEKVSYEFDKISFISSTVGLCFGIASLILAAVGGKKYDDYSWYVTIVAVVFDFSSAFLLTLGINQHLKYWHVKNIVKLAKESINMSNIGK